MIKIKYILNTVMASLFSTSVFAHGDEFIEETGNFHGGMMHMGTVPYYGIHMWFWTLVFVGIIVLIVLLIRKND